MVCDTLALFFVENETEAMADHSFDICKRRFPCYRPNVFSKLL